MQQNQTKNNLHVPGTYPAKVMDYRLMKSKSGTPAVGILFQYEDKEGKKRSITYFGSFHPNAKKHTINAVLNCGFTGKDGSELNKGKGSGVLNEELPVEIVISNEPNPMKGNELQSRVQWVNSIGGGAFKERMAEGEAKVLMGGLNLAGDFLAARQGQKAPSPSPAGQQAVSQAMQTTADVFGEEEIPF